METYNGKLCITHAELTNGIMSAAMVKYSTRQGGIERMRRGCNSTPALFAVDSLPLKYKTEVYRRYPDMKAQADSKPFIESIEPDGAALAFYQDHLLDDGKHLPTEKQHEYANNAAILNAFRAVLEKSNSQRARQNHRQANKTEFWRKAAQALPHCADTFPNSLPENPRRLQEKFNQYLREGYSALITGLYGLRNAAKIMTAEQESVIIKLLADPRNLDNSQIAELYNIICQHFQWKAITPRLVQFYREKHGLITSAGRLGASNFHNVKAMQNKREKPTAPLLFWTLDGWDVELYYQATETNKKGGNVTTYHHRPTVVIVLDPCEMYPIGYAVGTHETPELIKAALRDAANHTAALFGTRYRANQLQSDHYALKTLSVLYGAMSDKVTPARVKNAKSKIIEPYFGHLNKSYCQYQRNWSGFGITSDKTKQPNADALNAARHSFPTFEECVAQVCKMMEAERARKREAYLAKFAELPEERKLPLSHEQYLLNFGTNTSLRNAIEGQGLRPTIGGIKREYDCFDPNFRAYAHIRWAVKYDPDNLDRVLAVSEDGRLRFMLEGKYVQPMALANRKEGDAEQLARVDNFNKQLKSRIITQLAAASESTHQLIASRPALENSLAKAVLCDSNGQHKNRRNQVRLRAKDIEDVECTVINNIPGVVDTQDDLDTKDLY